MTRLLKICLQLVAKATQTANKRPMPSFLFLLIYIFCTKDSSFISINSFFFLVIYNFFLSFEFSVFLFPGFFKNVLLIFITIFSLTQRFHFCLFFEVDIHAPVEIVTFPYAQKTLEMVGFHLFVPSYGLDSWISMLKIHCYAKKC